MTFALADLARIAAAIAIIVGVWQIWQTRKQATTAFEDSLSKEYRKLASSLPTKALLGEPLTEDEHNKCFDKMYHYLDLCNEQIFLKNQGRISKKTWEFWKDGIESNLKRPAFEKAWSEIYARSNGDFTELHAIVEPKPFTKQGMPEA